MFKIITKLASFKRLFILGGYMVKYYTQQQFEQVKQTSLVQYLMSKGEQFKKEGNRYRHIKHDSLVINQDNKWFWNSRNLYGNNALSYLRLVEKMSLPDRQLFHYND